MNIKDAFEQHRLMRRTVLAVVLVLVIASVTVGLYHLLDLTGESVKFLLAVVALLNAPILYYFHQRSKQ